MITLRIWDEGDELKAEGKLDDPTALDRAPTAALIVGSYIGAHMETIARDAVAWANGMGKPVEKEPQLKLFGPDDITGAPV